MNEFFQARIQELYEAFTDANFAYYRNKSGSFNSIVVKGIGLYENVRFVEEQERIIDDFYSFFPYDDISFISNAEISSFPMLECVIDFRQTIDDWFSCFQLPEEVSYVLIEPAPHKLQYNQPKYSLAA